VSVLVNGENLENLPAQWRCLTSSPARELLDAVRRISLELPDVGVDVVEVSRPYDPADITAALANRIVLEALSAVAGKRRDERDGTTWDPSQPLLEGR